jgi:hypothetical protein
MIARGALGSADRGCEEPLRYFLAPSPCRSATENLSEFCPLASFYFVITFVELFPQREPVGKNQVDFLSFRKATQCDARIAYKIQDRVLVYILLALNGVNWSVDSFDPKSRVETELEMTSKTRKSSATQARQDLSGTLKSYHAVENWS